MPSTSRILLAAAVACCLALGPGLSAVVEAQRGSSNSRDSGGGFSGDRGRDNNNGGGFGFDGFDRDGYDRNGYGRDGFNRNGWGRDGYGRDGYDRDGYDRDGCNRWGYDRRGRRCTHHGNGNGQGNGNGHNDKVTVCHNVPNGPDQTIKISENALWAHLAHGDSLGPCAVSGYR